MIPGLQFAGPIDLSARLDGDGDPMSRSAGDVTGGTDAPVEPGATDVVIVLDERI